MKKTIISIALMLMLAAVGFGQKKMTTEQSLMKMEEEMAADLLAGKTGAFEKYLAPNAVMVDPGGMSMNKTETIASFKSGDLKFEASKLADMKVTMYGNTAIVTYRTTDKGKYKDMDISGEYRWTDTWTKINGKWLLVAGQGTRIMEMPK
jgi:ketosteroid isomerase-like protein